MSSISFSTEVVPLEIPAHRAFRLRHILTLRAYVFLIMIFVLLTGPVIQHSDLFAAVLGYSLLFLLIFTVSFTLVIGWMLRSQLTCTFTYDLSHFQSGKPHSKTPFNLFLRLSGGNIPPLFSLWILLILQRS